MKYSLLSALIAIFLVGITGAAEVTTRENYLACSREDHLEDIFRFIDARDTQSIRMYFATNKCDVLKEGLAASVTRSGNAGIAIDINGTVVWTVSQALAYN